MKLYDPKDINLTSPIRIFSRSPETFYSYIFSTKHGCTYLLSNTV